MITGKRNSLTDVSGLMVGNLHDQSLKSGVSVVLCDEPTIASVAVLGGGPGTRDIQLLEPENTVDHVDGLVLSGGSAFGLDAASGVQAYLRENGRGYSIGDAVIPIVPGAILFDLLNGGNKDWGLYPPYRDLGYEASKIAALEFDIGTCGAGYGATVAGLKGGLGTASAFLENGITVSALVAVNALGSPMIGDSRNFWAAPFEIDGEFGGFGFPPELPSQADEVITKLSKWSQSGQNTTIAIIATDALLTKSQVKRFCIAAHDGITRAIWPAHTPFDGDLVFGLATGGSKISPVDQDWTELGAMGASVLSRAIARGIFEAKEDENDLFPTWNGKFGE